MSGGFKITPSELHESGSQLGDFGQQVAAGGDKLADIGSRLSSNAGQDKSGVGAILVKALGKGTEVAGKVFAEGGRVAGQAGKRLHTSATAHEDNEADLTSSFAKIRSPEGTPKSPHDNGSGTPQHSSSGDSGNGGKPSGTTKPQSTDSDGPTGDRSVPAAGNSHDGAGHTAPSSTNPDDSVGSHNKNPEENDTPTKDRVDCGDPIDMSTGRMMLTQTDVEFGGVLALLVSRTHLSTYRIGRSFGASWASTVDQRVELDGEWVHFAAEDGTLLRYPRPVPEVDTLPELGPRWPLSLQEDGSLAITKPTDDRVLFFAPANGNEWPLSGITDVAGHQIWFARDEQGTLAGIEHSAGHRVIVTGNDGLITGLSLAGAPGEPDLELVRYTYDEQRNLTEVINSSGRPLRFDYDDQGRIVGWADRNGMWYRYEYDGDSRCVRTIGAEGFLNYTYAYDRENLVTTATDSLGGTTTFRLNPQLQVIAQTDPIGRTTRWEYDRYDRLLAETDPLGATIRCRYDEDGNLVEVTEPDGAASKAEYVAGLPVTVTEPDGAVWRREYNDLRQLIAVIDPLGARTSYTYDEHGHLATVTTALGATTHIESTPSGRPASVTNPLGAVTRYDYDRFGRTRAIIDPLGGVTRQSWTIEGLPLARTGPDGAVRRWAYDGEGNVRQTVDANGLISGTEVAHFDLPVTETAPDGTRLHYRYDTEARLTSITNATGRTWRYTYDAAGQLVSETDFDGRTLRYAHDAAGRLTERTNAAGQTVWLRWDARGRLAARVIGEETTEYSYDPADRLVRAGNGHTELVFDYDGLGQVVSETVNGRSVVSRYDAAGRRVYRRTPSGAESTWEFDAADRPVTLRTAGQLLRFTHDASGRETERRIGTAALLAQTWDAGDRLTTQYLGTPDNPAVGLRRYSYQAGGELRAVTEPGGTRHYELDQAGRVQAVRGEQWTERYAYDPAGNITRSDWTGPHRAPEGAREYAGTLLVRAGEFRYTYDEQGRTVSRQRVSATGATETWHYQWDAADRLIALSTPDGSRWIYRYDPLGRRIAKLRLDADGRTAEEVLFTWDGDQLVEQVHDRRRARVWDFSPHTGRVLSQTERSTWPGADREWVDQSFHAIVTDLVGTPVDLVDPRGTLAGHADATLWGDRVSTMGSADTPLRFPGQYHDPESGLHYNLYRYYDPATGRYLSDDPLGLGPGPNPRAYVTNPTGWIDPTGLTPCNPNELHQNPQGPSLRVRGPRRSGKDGRTPNKVRTEDSWNQVAGSNGRINAGKQRAEFDHDPQTVAEANRPAVNAIWDQSMGMTKVHNDVKNAGTGAQMLEQMGRHDSATSGYWAKQDGRDERLATDANALHGSTTPRPQAMLDQTDQQLMGTTDKLEGAQAVLNHHNGVIIAGDHADNTAFPFLSQHMGDLHQSGVSTIYSESLRDDAHQGMVNDYLQTGSMHPDLKKFLDMPNNKGLEDTLTAARTHGVHVQGTGGYPARRPAGMPGDESLHARASMYNTYASQVVANHPPANGGKYVMEVGEAHATTHAGPANGITIQGQHIPANFPGLGDIMNVPVLRTGGSVLPGGPDTYEQLR